MVIVIIDASMHEQHCIVERLSLSQCIDLLIKCKKKKVNLQSSEQSSQIDISTQNTSPLELKKNYSIIFKN